ncbi:hypothetical protein DSM106972_094600 [Dulcicalothrix desertica PCC 7102]|uniref:Uncharacterized protein n=2 Tax=Dulcicalothrix desertica TaxID=32056 RepID=A0A3S1BZ08_9CYAN|nr:hypothetical protein DSM106972_094600 [Dulcicalothrix desertica PCC 7102]
MPTTVIAETSTYGTTLRPRTCASRTEPSKGALSVEQAKMYFICDKEWQNGTPGQVSPTSSIWLIDNLDLKVASPERPFNQNDFTYTHYQGGKILAIDTEKPIYDIRGSYTSYVCYEINRVHAAGKNCSVTSFPDSSGICFRDTFSEWHCSMRGRSKILHKMPPPPSRQTAF